MGMELHRRKERGPDAQLRCCLLQRRCNARRSRFPAKRPERLRAWRKEPHRGS